MAIGAMPLISARLNLSFMLYCRMQMGGWGVAGRTVARPLGGLDVHVGWHRSDPRVIIVCFSSVRVLSDDAFYESTVG